MRRACSACLVSAFVVALLAVPCWAQRGGDWGGFPGGGDYGGFRGGFPGGSSGVDPGDMVRRADSNGNGVLEQSELENGMGRFVQRSIERANLNLRPPLQVQQ